MTGHSSPLSAEHLSTAWSMNVEPINTALAVIIPQGFRLHVSFARTVMCWDLLSVPFTNARRDIYPPRREHEISSRLLIISLDVLNVFGVASCLCTSLNPQQCPCKYGITGCPRVSIFSCLKHAAARTVWILPLASPCLLLSCISVPFILIQKPSELYLWAAGKRGTLLWK